MYLFLCFACLCGCFGSTILQKLLEILTNVTLRSSSGSTGPLTHLAPGHVAVTDGVGVEHLFTIIFFFFFLELLGLILLWPEALPKEVNRFWQTIQDIYYTETRTSNFQFHRFMYFSVSSCIELWTVMHLQSDSLFKEWPRLFSFNVTNWGENEEARILWGPAASIYVTLLRTVQSLIQDTRRLFPNGGCASLERSRRWLAARWWNIAAWAGDSKRDNTICLINLKLYYSRVKVYIACSHGDNTIALPPRVKNTAFRSIMPRLPHIYITETQSIPVGKHWWENKSKKQCWVWSEIGLYQRPYWTNHTHTHTHTWASPCRPRFTAQSNKTVNNYRLFVRGWFEKPLLFWSKAIQAILTHFNIEQ